MHQDKLHDFQFFLMRMTTAMQDANRIGIEQERVRLELIAREKEKAQEQERKLAQLKQKEVQDRPVVVSDVTGLKQPITSVASTTSTTSATSGAVSVEQKDDEPLDSRSKHNCN